ncbi:DNA-directed RNA polymerase subunit H [Candidatus Pacearchaeota archaeon]|nr:DNA-directed RNA polymerase subunit H [Candidatus Pacearchaeota archaeon]
MHALQPKHIRLKEKEAEDILKSFNISRQQLPKIKINDAALPKEFQVGDIIKIERQSGKERKEYYRVVVE